MSTRSVTRLRRGLAFCYFALLGLAVLTPQPVHHSTTFADNGPFVIGWLADAIRNVLLFAPLGAFVALERGALRHAIALAGAVAAGIELLQTVIPGRFSSPIDVVSNVLGAALGVLIVRWAPMVRRPAPPLAQRLVLASSLASATLFLISSALLTPVVPEGVYFGGFTPDLRHLEHYSGEVIDARLDALPIPAGGPAPADAPFPSVLRGRPLLELSFRPGVPPGSLAPLVTLHDAEEREILLVGLDGDTLVARRLMRAAGAGLENPTQRWPAVMPPVEGRRAPDELHRIGLRLDGPIWGARFDGRALDERIWTAGRGWALVFPIGWLPPAAALPLDVVWMALLGTAAAYHAGGRRRSRRLLLIPIVALAATPLVGSVAPARPAEWAGLLGAMGFALWFRAPRTDSKDER